MRVETPAFFYLMKITFSPLFKNFSVVKDLHNSAVNNTEILISLDFIPLSAKSLILLHHNYQEWLKKPPSYVFNFTHSFFNPP